MMPHSQIEALAARRLTEQEIADVLDIDLREVSKDREKLREFRESIRKGRAKGEAELRNVLYRRAKNGDSQAYSELLRREKQQDSD